MSIGTYSNNWALFKCVNIQGYPVENETLRVNSSSWFRCLDNWDTVDYQDFPHGSHRALETFIFQQQQLGWGGQPKCHLWWVIVLIPKFSQGPCIRELRIIWTPTTEMSPWGHSSWILYLKDPSHQGSKEIKVINSLDVLGRWNLYMLLNVLKNRRSRAVSFHSEEVFLIFSVSKRIPKGTINNTNWCSQGSKENQLRPQEIGLLWIALKHWFLKDPRGSFAVNALLASLGFVKYRKESLNVPHMLNAVWFPLKNQVSNSEMTISGNLNTPALWCFPPDRSKKYTYFYFF